MIFLVSHSVRVPLEHKQFCRIVLKICLRVFHQISRLHGFPQINSSYFYSPYHCILSIIFLLFSDGIGCEFVLVSLQSSLIILISKFNVAYRHIIMAENQASTVSELLLQAVQLMQQSQASPATTQQAAPSVIEEHRRLFSFRRGASVNRGRSSQASATNSSLTPTHTPATNSTFRSLACSLLSLWK